MFGTGKPADQKPRTGVETISRSNAECCPEKKGRGGFYISAARKTPKRGGESGTRRIHQRDPGRKKLGKSAEPRGGEFETTKRTL